MKTRDVDIVKSHSEAILSAFFMFVQNPIASQQTISDQCIMHHPTRLELVTRYNPSERNQKKFRQVVAELCQMIIGQVPSVGSDATVKVTAHLP